MNKSDEEIDLLLKECIEEVFKKSPDPSELPKPPKEWTQKLILIVSNDKMSMIMLDLLKPNLDKFDIYWHSLFIPDQLGIKIVGYPTVYDPKTKQTHLGVTCYKSLINFFK